MFLRILLSFTFSKLLPIALFPPSRLLISIYHSRENNIVRVCKNNLEWKETVGLIFLNELQWSVCTTFFSDYSWQSEISNPVQCENSATEGKLEFNTSSKLVTVRYSFRDFHN